MKGLRNLATFDVKVISNSDEGSGQWKKSPQRSKALFFEGFY